MIRVLYCIVVYCIMINYFRFDDVGLLVVVFNNIVILNKVKLYIG